jgi:hypothetical protein
MTCVVWRLSHVALLRVDPLTRPILFLNPKTRATIYEHNNETHFPFSHCADSHFVDFLAFEMIALKMPHPSLISDHKSLWPYNVDLCLAQNSLP